MAETYIKGEQIQEVHNDHEPRYANSKRQKQAARDLLAGKLKAPLDASILPNDQDREALRASGAQKYDLPLRMVAMIMEDDPRVKREPVGVGPRAMSVATRIEMIGNALKDMIYPREPIVDTLFNEGDAYCVTQPSTTPWDEKMPDSMYDDPDTKTRVSKRYAVDAKGRGQDDEHYEKARGSGLSVDFRAHEGKSSDYFDSVVKDFMARNVPITMRPMSGLEAIPINPHREGRHMKLEGLVRKSEWSVSMLIQKGYRWGPDFSMEPAGTGSSLGSRQATMYEYWGTTTSGHVYTSYCIDGKATLKDGQDAVIDLTEKFGIEQLPIAFAYGLNFAGAINPDDRPVPFTNIYGRTWLNRDTLMTSLLIRAYKESNLYRVYQPDVELLKYLGIGKGEVPMPDMVPGKIVPILGRLDDAHSTNSLRELSVMLGALTADLQDGLPSEDATGGGSDVAGYARNVARRDALGRFQPVIDGDLSILEQSMGYANEQMACIGRMKRPVCLFVNQEIPVEQRTTEQSSTRAIIEVDPEIFGDVWNVKAEIPVEIGDNMPLAAQLMDAHQRGEVPQTWVLEKGFGDPAPDVTIAQIKAEAAMNTPLGQARLNMMAATIAGDEELAEIMEAVAQGELMKLMPQAPSGPDNVVPTSMAAGVTPPHMMGAQNPAEAALQGIESGPFVGPQNSAQQMTADQGVPV